MIELTNLERIMNTLKAFELLQPTGAYANNDIDGLPLDPLVDGTWCLPMGEDVTCNISHGRWGFSLYVLRGRKRVQEDSETDAPNEKDIRAFLVINGVDPDAIVAVPLAA